jgi:hypothetical protein
MRRNVHVTTIFNDWHQQLAHITKELQHSISSDFYEILVWRIALILWSYKYCLFSIASWIKFNDCDEVGAFFYYKLTSDSKPNRTTWLDLYDSSPIVYWFDQPCTLACLCTPKDLCWPCKSDSYEPDRCSLLLKLSDSLFSNLLITFVSPVYHFRFISDRFDQYSSYLA